MIKEQKEIILNENQSEVLEQLLVWCNSDELFATLKGSAGTGKSTITDKFIKSCKFKFGVVVSAPTHKAKKVIETMTGLKSFTIQKLLGLRPNIELESFNINFPQFDSLAEREMQYYKMVIIDESSMLNKDLFDLICKEAREFKVKILFISDNKQLPPVNEVTSKVHTDIENVYELTTIVRQKNTNPLADLLILLRNDIEDDGNTFKEFLINNPTNVNKFGEGYSLLKNTEFQAKMNEYFNSVEYKLNKEHCKYTAWTNASVKRGNTFIRSCIINSEEILTKDDCLMGYKTIADKYTTYLLNSEEYTIHTIERCIEEDYQLDGYKVVLKSIDTNALSQRLFIVHPNSYSEFLNEHNKLLNTAKKFKGRAWKTYYDFKNSNLILEDIKDKRGTLIVKKDLDYGYGISVHKTQGSTYDNIFVNLDDINCNKDSIERKKLTYVALSRARTQVFIYSNQI